MVVVTADCVSYQPLASECGLWGAGVGGFVHGGALRGSISICILKRCCGLNTGYAIAMEMPSLSPLQFDGLTTGIVVGGREGEEGGDGAEEDGGTHLDGDGG